jgi:Ca-activated chloride channel family protein
MTFKRPGVVLTFCVAAVLTLVALVRAQQAPAFRTGVDLVSLNVTVTDGTARYVTDLQAEDFSVFENGVKQDVTFFNRRNLPISLALLLDTSASMENKLPTAQAAAIGFARRLHPQDLAEIIDFDSRVVVLQNFTNNAAALERAIQRTSAGGSTSLYNAIYIALKDLKKVVVKNVDEIRRQAIVVLSDGEDTSSLLPFEEVMDLAKRSETAIYTIGLRDNKATSSETRGFKEAEFVMRQFAQETGGRAFFPSQLSDLARYPTSWPVSTWLATPQRTPGAMARGGGSLSASNGQMSSRVPSRAISRRRRIPVNEVHLPGARLGGGHG